MSGKKVAFYCALFLCFLVVQVSYANNMHNLDDTTYLSSLVEEERASFAVHAQLENFEFDEGSLVASVYLDEVPDGALAIGADLKLTFNRAQEKNPAVTIMAPGASSAKVISLTRSDHNEIADKLQAESESKGYLTLVGHKSLGKQDETPVRGRWTITISDFDENLQADDIIGSLVVSYQSSIPLPEIRGDIAGAQPGFHRVQDAIPAQEVQPDNDQKPLATPQSVEAWEIIESETFEGIFPSSGWSLYDDSNDGYEYLWDDDDYKPHNGSWSGWPANGGANGIDPAVYYYPNNMNSWMVYGPFDLSSATDAETIFSLWREIEAGYDYIFFGVSADGTNFSGYQWDGNAGWTNITVGYADWIGDGTVWVGWKFYSDSSNVDDGPFVDDITISRDITDSSCGPYAAIEIPDDGTWVTYAMENASAPLSGIVDELDF